MNQCVPSWDIEDNQHPLPHPPPPRRFTLRAHSNSNSINPDVSTLEYEMAELTWENGQLAMHGLGTPRLPNKYTWKKQPIFGGGTLESVVNQATTILPHCKSSTLQTGCCDGGDELVPWFENHQRAAKSPAATSLTWTVDAMVPCSSKIPNDQEPSAAIAQGISACVPGCSTSLVGSRSGAAAADHTLLPPVNMAAGAQDWSIRADQSHQSVSGSATCCRDSRQFSLDTCDRELGTAAHTSTSLGSPENTSSAKQCTKTADDHDSPCQSRNEREARRKEEDRKKGNGKSSLSTKRSRAAAIHNQSERKRRDKINQRMKALQKLVPNSSKTDKASMLDEVIEYLKQLQAQLSIMSRMNMSQMMLPMALQQQQLQMPMMAPMGMGMSMGMGMGVLDLNSISRPNLTGVPPVLHPTAFMPTTSWDGLGDRLAVPSAAPIPDPLAAFLACQSQPMPMDAYSRIAALYQQFLQPPGPASKDKML